ncbi:hypothetical protein MW887_004798 [Aspergillus wentii]|nr:hypothetical protein MW887_004798 [Aspergillus wentii]
MEAGDDGYLRHNLKHVVITATCFAFVLSTVSVGLRILSRRMVRSGLFMDDFLIMLALVFEFGICAAGVVLLYNGLGVHISEVPPNQLTIYLKTLASGSFLYTLCVACIKLSILALYKRLFPIKFMVNSVNFVAALLVLWAFGVCLIGAVTCIPFEKLWNPMIPGGCIDLPKFYYGSQVPNIVSDAVILVMPMRVVWLLPISNKQKTLLSGIFVLGFLTLIFDIVRLVTLIQLSEKGNDVTFPSSVWTCIEPAVGITAACLSNMRPLWALFTKKYWTAPDSTSRGSAVKETLAEYQGR